jgi:hypothetical protein
MSNRVRLSLLIGIALLIVVFLVFMIQTFWLNRSPGDADTLIPINDVYNGYEENHYTGGTGDAPSPEQEITETPTEPGEPPNIWIPLLDDSYMTLLIPEDDFTRHDIDDTGVVFTGLDGASLEISLIPVGSDIAVFARGFLDPFIDFTDFVTEGLINIASSDISGYFVMAYNDDETYEAWIHDLGGGFGVAVIINYTNYTQRDALYDILDTLAIDN